MRVGRRGVITLLAASFACATGLFVAAGVHRADTFRSATRVHVGIEVLLWSGAAVACAVFAWASWRFRAEVRVEKARHERREVRQEYLREVRDYELTRSGPGGRWNN